MQATLLKFLLATLLATFAITGIAGGKVYGETEFLDRFGGRSKKLVMEKLGKPVKKQLSVKPSNANSVLRGQLKEDKRSQKRVKVEMWYYKNIVKYDDKHTYKETELTFVNDRVMNISFFNRP